MLFNSPLILAALPVELLLAILRMLPTRDITRVNGVARLFYGEPPPQSPQSLVEQVMRQRAAERGVAVPTSLLQGEATMVQALCRRDISARPRQIVAAGYFHSAFVDTDGQLLTCGFGHFPGLLGHGADVHVLVAPTPVPSLLGVRVRSVAAGARHNLVLLESGLCLSYGDGMGGKLGHGDEQHQCR